MFLRQNASYMHFTQFPQLFVFLPLHLPLSLTWRFLLYTGPNWESRRFVLRVYYCFSRILEFAHSLHWNTRAWNIIWKNRPSVSCIKSDSPRSLFHFKPTDGNAVTYTGSSLTLHLFITVQDTFARRRICLRVRGGFRLLNMQWGGGAKLVGYVFCFFCFLSLGSFQVCRLPFWALLQKHSAEQHIYKDETVIKLFTEIS